MRRSAQLCLFATVIARQGWGGAASGGWGSDSSSSGWGKTDDAKASWGKGGGGWGKSSSSESSWDQKGRGGGWGSDQKKSSWGGSDGGWSDAPSGAGRGRGRGGGRGRGRNEFGTPSSNVWGSPAAVDGEAWSSAPPSFNPPVRRVDPLTLTAVEVEIDGITKLVGQRVQIAGISDETTWHTLKDHLRQAGEVTFCKVFSGGRALVEFVTPEDAAKAITELQGSELEGATLFMREDREDTVLLNTRRKIREARDAQLRARKEEEIERRKKLGNE